MKGLIVSILDVFYEEREYRKYSYRVLMLPFSFPQVVLFGSTGRIVTLGVLPDMIQTLRYSDLSKEKYVLIYCKAAN